jgi:hypothetical protein
MLFAKVLDANGNEIDRLDLTFTDTVPNNSTECTCTDLQPGNIAFATTGHLELGFQVGAFSFGESIPEFDYEVPNDSFFEFVYEDSSNPDATYKVLRVKLTQTALDNAGGLANTVRYNNIVFKEQGTNNVLAIGTFIFNFVPQILRNFKSYADGGELEISFNADACEMDTCEAYLSNGSVVSIDITAMTGSNRTIVAYGNGSAIRAILFKQNNNILQQAFIPELRNVTGTLPPMTIYQGGSMTRAHATGWVMELEEYSDGGLNMAAVRGVNGLPLVRSNQTYVLSFSAEDVYYIDSDNSQKAASEYDIKLHANVRKTDGSTETLNELTLVADSNDKIAVAWYLDNDLNSEIVELESIQLTVVRKNGTPQRNGKMHFGQVTATLTKQY